MLTYGDEAWASPASQCADGPVEQELRPTLNDKMQSERLVETRVAIRFQARKRQGGLNVPGSDVDSRCRNHEGL
jgi:hypothetical protein